MKKQQKVRLRLTMITLMLFTLFVNGTITVIAQYEKVPTAGIEINGEVVDGIDPIILDGDYYLPLVNLSKILGYNHIQFEEGTLTYDVTDGSSSIRATMGGTKAKKGDEYINIEPPRWINKTAYVSLNAASSLFNAYITFKPENGSIQVQKPAQHYVVQSGDSLWAISQAHHTTVHDLKTINNLKSNIIFSGQKLKIPAKEKTKEIEPIREKEPVDSWDRNETVEVHREKLLNQATQFIGAGYKFGATLDEAPHLFDCSSYTQLVFKYVGIDIPRVSRDQARKGRYVTDLKAGDLMFFTNNELYSDGRVGHVGIYMGDGSMIHASTSLGVDITDNVLGNPYWGANYLFSKRIIE
ncbi:peptidoglycan endopeptidase [Anaerobacillus alkalidiazotrophicus]|uniref:Peptidoglycan endopeptidase n=1 Tax=Anaerobacillus alkalidiazotrophicus TaxID=472963 RepID=A0A1S2MA25_9BACI|nr:LysM peptidoglycan-binding domain-containing C40 family peptidase [Anaerobacillus alkalidiazotrophicus]OIJ21410.1 peptidoglycan endopeptidase [Anaerobacillus alkalidiazotrophicus]